MGSSCGCATETRTILVCSGASNVGQITNEVAKRLDQEGEARFFCLAGVGGHVRGMAESVKGAGKIVVLDGCAIGCARMCMDKAGITGFDYVIVTDLGIERSHEFNIVQSDIDKALVACRARLMAPARATKLRPRSCHGGYFMSAPPLDEEGYPL